MLELVYLFNMANAEGEKLNLLREHRASKEKFYDNLTILSGGTLTVVVTLVSGENNAIDNLEYCLITWIQISIYLLLTSLFFSVLRNFLASKKIKNIALDTKITEYEKVIEESVKEKWFVKLVSVGSIILFISGLFIFAFVAIQTIL